MSKNSYKEYSLDELGTIGRGKSTHRPRNDPLLFGGKYPFIQTGDVKAANLYVTDFKDTYNEFGLSQSKLWPKNTLLITIAANIAETAILGIEACFPDSIVGFIPDENIVNAFYIKYYIDYIKQEMQSISQGTTQDNLSLEKLRIFKFKIPEKTRVDEITNVLLTYDNLIENNNRRIAILEEIAQKLYREWFVHFRYPGHESAQWKETELGKVPEGWEVKILKDFGTVITGKTPSKRKPENYNSRDIQFIKTPDMHPGMFVLETTEMLSKIGADSQKNKYLPTGSIMVSCIGTAGIVAMNMKPAQTNQQINSIICNNDFERYFLYFSLLDLKQTILNHGSTGATMTNLSKGKFEVLKVITPTKELLIKYDYLVQPIFKQVLCLMQKNKNLKQQRDMLLPKLI